MGYFFIVCGYATDFNDNIMEIAPNGSCSAFHNSKQKATECQFWEVGRMGISGL